MSYDLQNLKTLHKSEFNLLSFSIYRNSPNASCFPPKQISRLQVRIFFSFLVGNLMRGASLTSLPLMMSWFSFSELEVRGLSYTILNWEYIIFLWVPLDKTLIFVSFFERKKLKLFLIKHEKFWTYSLEFILAIIIGKKITNKY